LLNKYLANIPVYYKNGYDKIDYNKQRASFADALIYLKSNKN